MKYEVVQGSVVVMTIQGGSVVVCVAVTNEAAKMICEGLQLFAASLVT